MSHARRIAVSLGSAAALVALAATGAAGGQAPDVPKHRHYLQIGSTMVPVGPQVCEKPSLQEAFNQFHAGVHVGTPGTMAMDTSTTARTSWPGPADGTTSAARAAYAAESGRRMPSVRHSSAPSSARRAR